MMWFGVAGMLFGVLGFAYAVRFYIELRRWAHLVKYGRIVVAHKGRVKLNAPLQEWALWCKMAEQDQSTNGRVIYQLGGTRIAVLRKSFMPDPPYKRLLNKVKSLTPKRTPTDREGAWAAEDQTEGVKS